MASGYEGIVELLEGFEEHIQSAKSSIRYYEKNVEEAREKLDSIRRAKVDLENLLDRVKAYELAELEKALAQP